jgi:hypothetical protein
MSASIKMLTLVVILLFMGVSTQAQNDFYEEREIAIGEVTNEIRMGKFAGNRNLSVGIKNILEEIVLELDYDLYDGASQQINVRLVFFDIKNMGTSIAVFRKGVALTQIAAIGELIEDGKVIKVSKQAGTSKQISQSTLIIAADGRFNQQTASIALKRVCEKIIKDLLE